MSEDLSKSLDEFRFQVSFSFGLNLESQFLQAWSDRPVKQRQSWVRSLLVLGSVYRNNKVGHDCCDFQLDSDSRKSHSINVFLKESNPDDFDCLRHLIDMPANRRPGWLRDTILWGFDTLLKLDQLILGRYEAVVQTTDFQKPIVSNQKTERAKSFNPGLQRNTRNSTKKTGNSSLASVKTAKNGQNALLKKDDQSSSLEAVNVSPEVVSATLGGDGQSEVIEIKEVNESIETIKTEIVLDVDSSDLPNAEVGVGLDLDLSDFDNLGQEGGVQKSAEPPVRKGLGLNALFRLP